MARNGTYHGDATLSVGRPRHMRYADAMAMVDARTGVEELTDECAVTIAAAWQGPRRGDGLGFAELASSGTVRLEDLADDMSAVFDSEPRGSEGWRAMNMLATWALNHPSRSGD